MIENMKTNMTRKQRKEFDKKLRDYGKNNPGVVKTLRTVFVGK
jgi:hypothetical protein